MAGVASQADYAQNLDPGGVPTVSLYRSRLAVGFQLLPGSTP